MRQQEYHHYTETSELRGVINAFNSYVNTLPLGNAMTMQRAQNTLIQAFHNNVVLGALAHEGVTLPSQIPATEREFFTNFRKIDGRIREKIGMPGYENEALIDFVHTYRTLQFYPQNKQPTLEELAHLQITTGKIFFLFRNVGKIDSFEDDYSAILKTLSSKGLQALQEDIPLRQNLWQLATEMMPISAGIIAGRLGVTKDDMSTLTSLQHFLMKDETLAKKIRENNFDLSTIYHLAKSTDFHERQSSKSFIESWKVLFHSNHSLSQIVETYATEFLGTRGDIHSLSEKEAIEIRMQVLDLLLKDLSPLLQERNTESVMERHQNGRYSSGDLGDRQASRLTTKKLTQQTLLSADEPTRKLSFRESHERNFTYIWPRPIADNESYKKYQEAMWKELFQGILNLTPLLNTHKLQRPLANEKFIEKFHITAPHSMEAYKALNDNWSAILKDIYIYARTREIFEKVHKERAGEEYQKQMTQAREDAWQKLQHKLNLTEEEVTAEAIKIFNDRIGVSTLNTMLCIKEAEGTLT